MKNPPASKPVKVRKSVGIWIRVSTEDQAKGESPEHHEHRAKMYVESREWEVREVYHLEAVSGKSVMHHPETQRMLKDVASGRITGLIFSKLARLARNTKELLEFSEIFRTYNADLVSLQESIDTSTPAGRLFYTMIAAMAQWEREEIVDRINASIKVRAELGKPLSGHSPFGYRWVEKKLVPDPAEAPVRRLIYELFAEHQRIKKVARLLNEAGHRTRNGGLFTDTTVLRLLRDPTAKGRHRANWTKKGVGGRSAEHKPESEWVWTDLEAIVDESLWDQCNRFLDERRTKGRKPGKTAVHLFAGLVVCHCGRKMYVPSNTPKYVCMSCRNKIPIIDVEGIFYGQLKSFFESSSEIANQLQRGDENIAERAFILQGLVKEREKVGQEIDRIYRLYVDEKLDSDGFGRFYQPLQERQKQLDEEIPRRQAELDILKIDHVSSDQVLHEAKDLYGRWPSLTREEKRRIVESITERIIVGEGELDINLCYLPSSEEMTKRQRSMSGSSPPRA